MITDGSLLLAMPVAVLAGLVSFFSPCVLPLVPGYLSYVSGVGVQELGDDLGGGQRSRIVLGSVLFVAGFSVVFVAGGALFGALSQRVAMHERGLSIVMGLIVIAFALIMLLPVFQRDVRVHAVPFVGLGVAPLLGAFFGLGWVPCVSPTLGAVLGLAGNEATAGRGALLTAAYCAGLGIPFVLAALGFERFAHASSWLRRHRVAVGRFGAGLLLVVGVLLVTGWWNDLIGDIQAWAGGFEVPV